MTGAPLTVLVVGEGAAALASALARHEGLDPSSAGGVEDALAFLDATTFDVVLARPDATDPLRAYIAKRSLKIAVQMFEDRPAIEWAQRLLSPEGTVSDGAGVLGQLTAMQAEIADVVHALNNPLAVIVGNAQLAQELAKAVDTDPTIAAAVDDIAHAGAELGLLFGRVRDLRDAIDVVRRSV